jgi:myo-inositol-1(or 4)-monophosphatase
MLEARMKRPTPVIDRTLYSSWNRMMISALLEAHCEYSRLGSGAIGLAMTADGRMDGYWEAHINIWDVAAGLCIIKEAGGWTNDFMSGDVSAW